MGLALGDYLHNGRLSIAVSHFSEQYLQLFRNDGALTFTDVSGPSGIARATTSYVGWGEAFCDFENNGWPDLIVTNGHIYPQVSEAKIGLTYRQPTQLFVNKRDGTFVDASAGAGAALAVPRIGRGLAVGDLFNDGLQEVVIEDLEGEPAILRPERSSRNHWIGFQLNGTKSNKMALNARIRVISGELSQFDEVRSSGSYLSQNDLRPHFGLGEHRQADRVEIQWPSGHTEILSGLEADRFYCITEGLGQQTCKTAPGPGRQ
jgi:hypothetical protein